MPTNNDELTIFHFIEVDLDDEPVKAPVKAPAAKPVGFALPPVAQAAQAAPTPAPVVAPTPAPIVAPTQPQTRSERLASFLAQHGVNLVESLDQLRAQRLAIQSATDLLIDRMRLRTTPERLETLADLQTLLRRIDARVVPVAPPAAHVPIIPEPTPAASRQAQVEQHLPGVLATPAVPTRAQFRAMPTYQAPVEAPKNQPKNQLTENLVVVREDAEGEAGRIVTWTGHSVSAEKLTTAWVAEQLGDHRPMPASTVVAFSRAVKELQDKQVLVRAAGEQQEGYCIVEERRTTQASRLAHRVVCRFWLNGAGIQFEAIDGNTVEVEHYRRTVEAEFARASDVVEATDVTSWLVKEVRRLGGWAIRESGGIYFVPQRATARVEGLKRALKTCGVTVRAIPAMRNTDAVLLALDGLAERTTRQLGKLRDEAQNSDSAKNVVKNRLDTLDAMRDFVAEQEGNLGLKLDAMRAEIAAVRKLWAAHTTRGNLLEIG